MTYISGCVLAVPTANKEQFEKHALIAEAVFRDHGALQVIDAWGDDVPRGDVTDFYGAVAAKEDETIVFSWLIWPDKETSEKAMEGVMSDPRMEDNPMPFDGKRMIFGGFVPIQAL